MNSFSETTLSHYWLDETPRPYVLICPGGGYETLSLEKEGTAISHWMQQQGYHAGILSYQIKNKRPDTFLENIKVILKELQHHPNISSLILIGFSAGGHVAGLIASEWPRWFEGIILCYPVVSLVEDWAHQGSKKNFLQNMEEKASEYSVEKRITPDFPPSFIWHTVADQSVPVMNSLTLAKSLNDQGISFELHLFPDGRHGLGILPENKHTLQWKNLAENWLNRLIEGASNG